MTSAVEKQLVQECRRGSQEAFSRLYAAHKDAAFSLAMHHTRDPVLAEDVTQRAFVRAFRSLDTFRGEAQFGTWLHRIILNLCIDERRKQSRSRTVQLDDGLTETLPARERSDERVTRRELDERLKRALDGLSEPVRESIRLKYISGMTYAEIAGVMGCSRGTVGSRISRGLEMLASRLKDLKNDV